MNNRNLLMGAFVVAGLAGGVYLLTRKQIGGTAVTQLGAVTGIHVSTTSTGATVTFTPPTGATYAELLVTDKSGNPATVPVTIGGKGGVDFQLTGTSATITATPGQQVNFTLRGCNQMGCGPFSAVQGFTTLTPTPGNIIGITVSQVTTSGATITWNNATDNGVVPTSFTFQHTDGSGNASSLPITINGQSGASFNITPGSGPTTTVTWSGGSPDSPGHFIIQGCN